MKISSKIALGFSALIALNASIGIWLYQATSASEADIQQSMLESHEHNQAAMALLRAKADFVQQMREWKNTLMLGDDPQMKEKYFTSFKENGLVMQGELESAIAYVEKINPTVATKINLLKTEHEQLVEKYTNALASYKEGDAGGLDSVDNIVKGIDRPLLGNVIDLSDGLMNSAITSEEKLIANAKKSADNSKLMLLVLIFGGLFGGLTATLVSAFSINRGLRRIIDDLSLFASQTANASGHLSTASQSLADGTSETAAALEETSASIEEISGQVRQASANSESTTQVATQARETGERGAKAIAELASAISKIKENADRTAKIVKTIDEIAFQTNLLALNAAVEAARAGDAGKGFAVVAEEVRNLAQRAGEAARNTTDLIEQSVSSAENGVTLSKNVIQVVSEMTTATRRVNDLVSEIAGTSREINSGIGQIAKAVRQMDQTTQSNAASAEENSALGSELSRQADSLLNVVTALETMVRNANNSAKNTPDSHNESSEKLDHQRRKLDLRGHLHTNGHANSHSSGYANGNNRQPVKLKSNDRFVTANAHNENDRDDNAHKALPLPDDHEDNDTLRRF